MSYILRLNLASVELILNTGLTPYRRYWEMERRRLLKELLNFQLQNFDRS